MEEKGQMARKHVKDMYRFMESGIAPQTYGYFITIVVSQAEVMLYENARYLSLVTIFYVCKGRT